MLFNHDLKLYKKSMKIYGKVLYSGCTYICAVNFIYINYIYIKN